MAAKLSRKKRKLSFLDWLNEFNLWSEWYMDGTFWFHDVDGVKFKKEDNSIKYFFDMPGIEKKDITISLENGYLIAKGKSEKDYISDRYYSVYVGDVDGSNISATLDKGVLIVEIPNKESKNKIKIAVK